MESLQTSTVAYLYLSFYPIYHFERTLIFLIVNKNVRLAPLTKHNYGHKNSKPNVFSVIVLPKINCTGSLKASRHLMTFQTESCSWQHNRYYHMESYRGFHYSFGV